MIHAREDYNRIQDPNTGIGEPPKVTTNMQLTGNSTIGHCIGIDEPVMLFRAKDVLAPVILSKYADLLRLHLADPRMIQTVLAHEALMRKWQRINGCKMPDLPEELLAKVEI